MASLTQWPSGMTWAYRAIFKQTHPEGGSIVVHITPGPGNEMILLAARAVNSGVNGMGIWIRDKNHNAVVRLGSVRKGPKSSASFPSIGSPAAEGDYAAHSTGLIVSGSDSLSFEQNETGAQSDTLTIAVRARIKGDKPRVYKEQSTHPQTVATTTVYDEIL